MDQNHYTMLERTNTNDIRYNVLDDDQVIHVTDDDARWTFSKGSSQTQYLHSIYVEMIIKCFHTRFNIVKSLKMI